MGSLVKWFTGNHVAANALMVVVLLAGVATWFKLRKEIFPETSADAFSISVPFPTATPEDVELGVILPIEEAIADVNGIERMTSRAAENVGTVSVEVETGYDVREVMADVKTRVDAIENFAEETEQPVIEEIVIAAPVMSLAISAKTDELTLRELAEKLRNDLLVYEAPPPQGLGERIARLVRGPPTVTKVVLAGVRDYEISIEVAEERLQAYGLSMAEVAAAVRGSSLDLPGGSVRTEGGEVLVRALSKRYVADEFRNIVVRSQADGAELRLAEIADIRDGFAEQDLRSRFNGESAVLLNISRVGRQDTLELASMVKSFVEEIRKDLPPEVSIEVWNDQSVYLDGRLKLLAKNGSYGLVLVVLVLALFLRPALALLVALGIPISFAGGIWLMPWMGISVNMISLFGFILVLGIVVDDAIVVGENVYRRMRLGEHPKEAAWRGTHEVGVVVTFGVLTTAVAFTPMLGVSGVSGKIWPNIPLVVIPVLLFSLIQSKLVLPSHLALLSPSGANRKVGWVSQLQRRVAGGLEWVIEYLYQPAIRCLLQVRYLVLGVFLVSIVLIVGLVGSGRIRTEFFPQVEGDLITVKYELAVGAPFLETQQATELIEERALRVCRQLEQERGEKILANFLASSGTQPLITEFAPDGPPVATHIGEVTLELTPAVARRTSASEVISAWRAEVGQIPGITSMSYTAQAAGGGNAIDLLLRGDDLDELTAAADFLKEKLADYPGVIDIASSDRLGKLELLLGEPTPRARALGLDTGQIARQVRAALYGEEVQRLQRGRNELKVMVRYPEEDRLSLAALSNLKIRTAAGAEASLPDLVSLELGRGADEIRRQDRRRAINLTADVDKASGANANETVAAFTEEVLSGLRKKFPGVAWSFEGEQKDQRQSVVEIGLGFVFALLVMYLLMAIPLRSYLQPIIVMSVIPFGIVGAVLGHVLMGLELSIMSMCGIVALAGVVVNSSLVLVDYINRHRLEVSSLNEAVTRAGVQRFRPILLTSLTTFVGLMPMLLETDLQARFLIPMAVSLSFGILFATLITLVLVPSVYLILEDLLRLFKVKDERLVKPDSSAEKDPFRG